MLVATVSKKRKILDDVKDEEDYIIGVGSPPCGKTKKGLCDRTSAKLQDKLNCNLLCNRSREDPNDRWLLLCT